MTALTALFPEGSRGRKAAEHLDQRATPLPLLASAPYDLDLSREIQALDGVKLLQPAPVHEAVLAEAARSGLLLWNDDFEAGHEIAQGIESAVGSYWHGIAHRREGRRGAGLDSNLNNARHWFRRVGTFSTFESLYDEALKLLEGAPAPGRKPADLQKAGHWDPFLFLDWCQACEHGDDPESRGVLEAIQAFEMRLLLEYCVSGAVGMRVSV